MIPEKPQKKRAAYGLPPNPEAYLESAQDVQSIFAKGLHHDGSFKPEAVLALLKFNKVNVTLLAEMHDYSEAYFRQVISREKHNVVVEDIIAARLGIAPDRMWGRQFLGEAVNA
jgi:lambda repressor-like predicted transcriptional regulator